METKEQPAIAHRIHQVCKDKGLNINELSKELGISSTAIYKIVSGDTRSPSMDILIKFYQKLDVDMTWLATGEGAMYSLGTAETGDQQKNGGSFGDRVISKMTESIEEMRELFEEELRAKNQQIANLMESQRNLQDMLKMVLGKSRSVTFTQLPSEDEEFNKEYDNYVGAAVQRISNMFGVPMQRPVLHT